MFSSIKSPRAPPTCSDCTKSKGHAWGIEQVLVIQPTTLPQGLLGSKAARKIYEWNPMIHCWNLESSSVAIEKIHLLICGWLMRDQLTFFIGCC